MIPVILATVLIFIIFYIYLSRPDVLGGFWVADDAFCADAGITSMLIYFQEDRQSTRPGYMVIMDDVCNQGFEINTGLSWSMSPYHYKSNARVVFDDTQIWPEDITLQCDITANRLLITSGDQLLAVLKRDS